MQRLREPMQDHIANSPPRDSSRNVVELAANPPELPNSDPLETLEVLATAVKVFMNMERRAIEIEARAKSLVERAVEKLHLAESRIRSAEEARHAAEENLDSANAELQKTKSRLGILEIRPVSQLNTQPVATPVNASRLASRPDSRITRGQGGWLFLALQRTCTSYSSASLTGARRYGSKSGHSHRPTCPTQTWSTEGWARHGEGFCKGKSGRLA